MEWTTEFPKEVGDYWFYGYRYGYEPGSTSPNGWVTKETEPEYMHIEVFKIANGFMHKGSGQFVFESEIENGYYMKIEMPTPPEDFDEFKRSKNSDT